MEKNQRTRWNPQGAHLSRQFGMRVLNDGWEDTFREWYPGFRSLPQRVARQG